MIRRRARGGRTVGLNKSGKSEECMMEERKGGKEERRMRIKLCAGRERGMEEGREEGVEGRKE